MKIRIGILLALSMLVQAICIPFAFGASTAPDLFIENGKIVPPYSTGLIPKNKITVTPAIKILYGDANQDGTVDSADYTLLRRYLLVVLDEPLPQGIKERLDLNCDGAVDSADYTILRKFLLEQITELPYITCLEVTPTTTPTTIPSVNPTATVTPSITNPTGTTVYLSEQKYVGEGLFIKILKQENDTRKWSHIIEKPGIVEFDSYYEEKSITSGKSGEVYHVWAFKCINQGETRIKLTDQNNNVIIYNIRVIKGFISSVPTNINVKTGEYFEITLIGGGYVGRVWKFDTLNTDMAEFVKTRNEGNGFGDSPIKQIFTFKALKPGEVTIYFSSNDNENEIYIAKVN